MCALIGLLWHHIHVGLQDCHLAIFHTRCGRFAHNDVLGIVLECFYATLFCPVEQKFLHLLQMSAGTWNLCEQIEIVPNSFWSELLDRCCHILYVFCVFETK